MLRRDGGLSVSVAREIVDLEERVRFPGAPLIEPKGAKIEQVNSRKGEHSVEFCYQ